MRGNPSGGREEGRTPGTDPFHFCVNIEFGVKESEPIRATIPDMGILVNVPSPSRFMVHKVVVSAHRRDDTKRIKDGL